MPIQRVLHEPNGALVKVWTDDIEASALQQLRNMATLPFIYKHIAVMSDCHWGLGSTVGSVIPTIRAIVPAAVGVDIGCFVGETKIPLLNGKQLTLAELALGTEPFWVYSVDANLDIAPGRARCTGRLQRYRNCDGKPERSSRDRGRVETGDLCQRLA